ncbi:hypothetical protein FB559_4767 [Actinoallomurus bryophytorum]|uniref:Uncharacterized protein n=1 Tax=Actinoallomurus bryophytorum TaxID=1490222 RepID=A0A543CPS8_9ACTN|nr:hypothetical protein FB559_4767 [Actinoallomurus bryophytorum]
MNMGANSGSGIWWNPDAPAIWLGPPSPDSPRPASDADASGEDEDT